MTFLDLVGQLLTGAMLLFFVVMGIWGTVIIIRKGYLRFFGGFGIIIWIFFGWAAILVPAVLIAFGPFTWAFAKYLLKPKQRCPGCQKWLKGNVTRCPHCTSEIEPLY